MNPADSRKLNSNTQKSSNEEKTLTTMRPTAHSNTCAKGFLNSHRAEVSADDNNKNVNYGKLLINQRHQGVS